MIKSEEIKIMSNAELNSVSEGEAILADRACKRLFKMSLQDVNIGFVKQGKSIPKLRFDALVETGALNGCNRETSFPDNISIKSKIIFKIKHLEQQINEYRDSLSLLNSKDNTYAWD